MYKLTSVERWSFTRVEFFAPMQTLTLAGCTYSCAATYHSSINRAQM